MKTEPNDQNFSSLLANAKLVRRSDGHVIHEGFGRVSRSDTCFQIECVVPNPTGNLFGALRKPLPAGTLLTDEHMFDFIAHRPCGELLVAERIHPSTTINSSGMLVLDIKCRHIWTAANYPVPQDADEITITLPLQSSNYYLFAQPPKDQLNRPLYEFTHRRFAQQSRIIKVNFYENETAIQIKCRNPEPIETLIQDIFKCFSFSFSENMRFKQCHVTVGDKHSTLTSADWKENRGHPIVGSPTSSDQQPDNLLHLISCCFSGLENDRNKFSDLFSHAQGIALSSGSFAEERALSCSRALEHAIKVCDRTRSTAKKESILAECKMILTSLSNLSMPLMEQRINNYLKGATDEGIGPKLQRNEKTKSIPCGTKKAFQNLRNKVAHGYIFKQNEFDKAYQQTQLLRDAFHRIVLRELEYKGTIVSYAINGWPVETLN